MSEWTGETHLCHSRPNHRRRTQWNKFETFVVDQSVSSGARTHRATTMSVIVISRIGAKSTEWKYSSYRTLSIQSRKRINRLWVSRSNTGRSFSWEIHSVLNWCENFRSMPTSRSIIMSTSRIISPLATISSNMSIVMSYISWSAFPKDRFNTSTCKAKNRKCLTRV